MAITLICKRAWTMTRLLLFSCCALAVGSSAAEAQTASFRDASLMNVSATATSAQKSVPQVAVPFEAPRQTYAASQISSEQPRWTESKIKQVGAALPAPKPRVVRQTQYSDSPVKPAITQKLTDIDFDKPFEDVCPDPNEMPSIADIPYKVVPSPGAFPENCPLPDEEFRRKAPTPITFTWKASSLCYKPLYFEDVQLERYGHYCHPLLQPFCSRVKFWLTIPVLPYLMGVNPPYECVYDLGYYRPGNCAPSMIEPVPISLRGGLMEAGAVVGLAAVIP